jgi:hypothetical protein
MGVCNNCGKHIGFIDGETRCPNCGELPYNCWNCFVKINEKPMEECSICHWAICECDKCSPVCKCYGIAARLHISTKSVRDIAR